MSYDEYRAAVVTHLAKLTGWTDEDADAITGEVHDMVDAGLDPEEAADEILAACDSE